MPRAAKSKKRTPGVGAGEAANLLDAIHQHKLDEHAILRILQVDQTPCDHVRSPCRTNRKDHATCFCQLVPAETSFRKKGLWQKDQAHLANLGRDPAEDTREDDAKPPGLRNLGNTCYANAALQCLFSIPSLRNGILTAEPRVAAHDIFRELRGLFLQMQFGPRSSVDTEELAKTLGLNHAIQQDGQEFLKLVLTRVEQMLSKSTDAVARGLVQRLFRGGLSYVTTCQRCGRDSASSREVQDFYDLMPQVRGFKSLTESLAALLHADSLTGDNRYLCEFCADKVDALRHVRLRSLPPYLCLALQRFYFDPRTADKAKALDKFSFPLQLDFRQVLAVAGLSNAAPPAAASDDALGAGPVTCAAAATALEVPQYAAGSSLYELVAILIHKGTQASSGHYVAHIKDQSSGIWWRLDDENVDCMGSSPTKAFQADHGSTAGPAVATGPDGGTKGSTIAGTSRKRAAPGDDAYDPDYEEEQDVGDQQADEDEGPPSKSARGLRGKKATTQNPSRSRATKRAAVTSRTRGKSRVASDDAEMARGLKASLEMQSSSGEAEAAAQDDEILRRVLETSRAEQPLGSGDLEMAAVLAESARLHASAYPPDDGAVGDTCGCGHAPIESSALPEGSAAAAAMACVEEGGRGEPYTTAAQETADDMALAGRSFGSAVHLAGQALWTEVEDVKKAPKTAVSSDVVTQDGGQVVSANAYMLVYRAVGFDEPPVVSEAASLPRDLQMSASAATSTFVEQCDVYQRQLKELKEQVAARQLTVREVMAIITPRLHAVGPQQMQTQTAQEIGHAGEDAGAADTEALASEQESPAAASHGHGTVGFWVSTAWLERWANDEGVLPPLDNSPIVCTNHRATAATNRADARSEGEAIARENGDMCCARVDPNKISAAKLVSPQAWKRLLAAHGGGPELAAGDVCRECLANNFSATLLGSQADIVRARVASLLEESGTLGQVNADGCGLEAEHLEARAGPSAARRFWVSRIWLQGWSKRQGASIKAEKSPTADIVCPHGGLLAPDIVKTARRVAVPSDVWYFLRDLWRQQRVREAQDALEAGSAVSAKARFVGRTTGRSGGVPTPKPPAFVDCLDLTGDDRPVAAAQCGQVDMDAAGSCKNVGKKSNGGGVSVDDDDVIEVMERTLAEASAASVAPSSREDTDTDDARIGASSSCAAKPSTAPQLAIPSPQELNALCPELDVGQVHECRECRRMAGQAAEAQVETRRQVDAERVALAGLAADATPALEPGTRYYLVPSSWVRDWQQFVRPVSRRVGGGVAPCGGTGATSAANGAGGACAAPAAQRPGPVSEAILRVLCPCHPNEARVGVPLPRLTIKRNKICQQDPDQEALRIIQENDWRQLCRLYGGLRAGDWRTGAGGSTAAQVAIATGDAGDLVLELEVGSGSHVAANSRAVGEGACSCLGEGAALRLAAVQQGITAELVPPQALAVSLGTGGSDASGANATATDDLTTPLALQRNRCSRESPRAPELSVWPPVCPEALAAHSRSIKEAMLSYSDAEIMVEMVSHDELDGTFRSTIHAPERKSKRSRKGRISLMVSNTTTLEQLKLQVYEHLSIHPRNQSMYVRGEDGFPRRLEGDDLSLAQHEVLPGEEIRLVRCNVVDDDGDMTDLLGASGGCGKKRQMEEGFKNTALHGDLPAQHREEMQQAVPASAEAPRPSGAPLDSSAYQSEGVLSEK